jgi:hypothetical protein
MAETKKRTYQAETISAPLIQPTHQPAGRSPSRSGSSPARRQTPQDSQPKQDLIIRLIDYLKSM